MQYPKTAEFQKKTTAEVCNKTVICHSCVERAELAYILQMACVSFSTFFVGGEKAFYSGRRDCPFFRIPQTTKQTYHSRSRFLQEFSVQILHRSNAVLVVLITGFNLLRHKSKTLKKTKNSLQNCKKIIVSELPD